MQLRIIKQEFIVVIIIILISICSFILKLKCVIFLDGKKYFWTIFFAFPFGAEISPLNFSSWSQKRKIQHLQHNHTADQEQATATLQHLCSQICSQILKKAVETVLKYDSFTATETLSLVQPLTLQNAFEPHKFTLRKLKKDWKH